jgi:hypothetical protein
MEKHKTQSEVVILTFISSPFLFQSNCISIKKKKKRKKKLRLRYASLSSQNSSPLVNHGKRQREGAFTHQRTHAYASATDCGLRCRIASSPASSPIVAASLPLTGPSRMAALPGSSQPTCHAVSQCGATQFKNKTKETEERRKKKKRK